MIGRTFGAAPLEEVGEHGLAAGVRFVQRFLFRKRPLPVAGLDGLARDRMRIPPHAWPLLVVDLRRHFDTCLLGSP
jgi:hypothetical protein